MRTCLGTISKLPPLRPKRKRTDLRLDVSPLSRSVQLDKLVVELLSHVDDSVGHPLDLGKPAIQSQSSSFSAVHLPLVVKRLVTKNSANESGTTVMSVGVQAYAARTYWTGGLE
jgi:hypothetical protein